jgi:hypothetical protein
MRLINYPASQATEEEKQIVDASLFNNTVIGPDSQELLCYTAVVLASTAEKSIALKQQDFLFPTCSDGGETGRDRRA